MNNGNKGDHAQSYTMLWLGQLTVVPLTRWSAELDYCSLMTTLVCRDANIRV